MDVSGIAGAGKSHLLKQVEKATIGAGKTIASLSPTDASVKDLRKAKGWYVSLSRAREAMHVYTRNKLELRRSVMQPGERKSVWELLQALQRSKPQPGDRKMPDLWATRQARIDRDMEMDR